MPIFYWNYRAIWMAIGSPVLRRTSNKWCKKCITRSVNKLFTAAFAISVLNICFCVALCYCEELRSAHICELLAHLKCVYSNDNGLLTPGLNPPLNDHRGWLRPANEAIADGSGDGRGRQMRQFQTGQAVAETGKWGDCRRVRRWQVKVSITAEECNIENVITLLNRKKI